jgi:hypothetical protein
MTAAQSISCETQLLEIRANSAGELGVYTTIAVPFGQRLARLAGPVVPLRTRYTIERDNVFYDPAPPLRFINHSCAPNSSWSGHDLLASRHLSAGEEVTWDYLETEQEIAAAFACLCGSPGCRGSINNESALARKARTSLPPETS